MRNASLLPVLLFSVVTLSLAVLTGCAGRSVAEENAPVESVPVPELLVQADALYKDRDQNLQKVKDALQLLRRARVADAENFEVAWKIAKFNYFVGNNTPDEQIRTKAFNEGINAGKAATKLQPNKPDGYFWLGANLGGQAKANVIDGAANVGEIKQNMNKVIELQPNYQGATAYVALAQVELQTRGMLGGDADKAVELLEKALSLEKNNSFIYLYLAEAYLATGRKAEARKMLDTLAKLPLDPEYAAERRETDEKAAKLEGRF
jgi:tetratricopeptide (TPR) repeat protein